AVTMPTIASPATRSTSLVVGKPSDGFICNVSDGQHLVGDRSRAEHDPTLRFRLSEHIVVATG
ncbi:hypothetical protein ACHIPZ_18520, partial [Antrihabitans sp. NCIMB 15449]